MSSIYDYPFYYDIAFQRDLDLELTFLHACIREWSDVPIPRFLEMGCGPAYHARALAKQKYEVIALDISASMVEYAAEKALEDEVDIDFVCNDMLNFKLNNPVHVALSMMATLNHIFTIDHMVQHLRNVAENLTPDGLYIIELPHPRDLLMGIANRATNPKWRTSRDGVTIDMVWGNEQDPVNSVLETRTFNVEMTVNNNGLETRYQFEELQAIWTPKEMEAAIKLSGCFELCAIYGEFDINQVFNHSKWSWRMISVLKVLRV